MLESNERLKNQVEAVRLGVTPARMTWGERILAHVRELPTEGLTHMDTWPLDATQNGIGNALGISRAHVALELKRLRGKGVIAEMLAHVAGGRQVRKVYRVNPNPMVIFSHAGEPLPIVSGTLSTLKVVVMRCPTCGRQSKVALHE